MIDVQQAKAALCFAIAAVAFTVIGAPGLVWLLVECICSKRGR